MMTHLVIDQSDINAVLDVFSIPSDEYFLKVENNTIYLHWVTSSREVKRYFKNDTQCLDIDISGTWKDAQSIASTEDIPMVYGFIACRYILAA